MVKKTSQKLYSSHVSMHSTAQPGAPASLLSSQPPHTALRDGPTRGWLKEQARTQNTWKEPCQLAGPSLNGRRWSWKGAGPPLGSIMLWDFCFLLDWTFLVTWQSLTGDADPWSGESGDAEAANTKGGLCTFLLDSLIPKGFTETFSNPSSGKFPLSCFKNSEWPAEMCWSHWY